MKQENNGILKKYAICFENYAIAEDELWLTKVLPMCTRVQLVPEPFYHWRQSVDSALRGTGNYEKWYSALEAKSKVVHATTCYPKLYELSVAKVYNDVFDVVWSTYVNGDTKISNSFIKELQLYKMSFYKSGFFSNMKKMKFLIIELLVLLHFPRRTVKKLGLINGYRIKEKIYV